MGLETVELVMDAEEEFGITMPDDALQGIATVGAFNDFVLCRAGRSYDSNAARRPAGR